MTSSATVPGQTVRQTQIPTRGPFSLEELTMFGFGHRSEAAFDGVMRLAFCLDGDFETHVGVEVRQAGEVLNLMVHSDPSVELAAVSAQVARILSCDHDGDAFAEIGRQDSVIGRLQAAAPGLRPPMFYSPYEAAVWSIISARRPRAQGIKVRERMGAEYGTTFELAGAQLAALPTPSSLRRIESIAGLPADRIGRLHAVADAALAGELTVEHLNSMSPDEAMAELQRLPGIGPFYSALVVVRACGLADVLPIAEQGSRDLVQVLYGLDHSLSDSEYVAFAERWKPFRTWSVVLIRAASKRILTADQLPKMERPAPRSKSNTRPR